MSKENKSINKKINPKTVYVIGGVVIGLLLASTISFGAMAFNKGSNGGSNQFTVTYVANNEVVYTETVAKNQNVQNVPSVPTVKGNDVTWSSDGTNIQDNTVITAVLTPKTYNITYLTNIIEEKELTLQVKGHEIDIPCYTNDNFLHYYFYWDFDGTNFVYEDITYNFNSDYSQVYNGGDVECAVSDNCFAIRNGHFTLSEENTRLSIEGYTTCDNKGLFYAFDSIYKIDYENNTVRNVTKNTSDSTEFVFKDADDNFIYDPKTNKVLFTDESELDVTNNKFVKDTITYQIDINPYKYYMIGHDEAGYKTGYTPSKTSYTYGEDLYFDTISFKVKLIRTTGFLIDERGDTQPDDFGWRTVNQLNAIFLEENPSVERIEGGMSIYNPIGDIIIYVSFSNPSN